MPVLVPDAPAPDGGLAEAESLSKRGFTHCDYLPEALTRIPDVVKTDAQRFAARLAKASCLLLHLSEGTDASARNHFLALKTVPERQPFRKP